MGGSALLQIRTKDSDVDTICIVPENIRVENFFGTQKCNRRDEKRHHSAEGEALYCLLSEVQYFPKPLTVIKLPYPLYSVLKYFQFDKPLQPGSRAFDLRLNAAWNSTLFLPPFRKRQKSALIRRIMRK